MFSIILSFCSPHMLKFVHCKGLQKELETAMSFLWGLFSLWACKYIAFVCVCVCVYVHRLSPQVELWFPCFRSRSCYSGREWRQLCLQLKSWHTFTRIYYSYRSVSGRDLRPPVYLTNSPFCELSVHSKLCSHWWIEFLWALLTNILTEGQGQ